MFHLGIHVLANHANWVYVYTNDFCFHVYIVESYASLGVFHDLGVFVGGGGGEPSQQTQDIDPMLIQHRHNICDVGSKLNEHRARALCLLGWRGLICHNPTKCGRICTLPPVDIAIPQAKLCRWADPILIFSLS